MQGDIKNLIYTEQDVGQHIKSTKKHFIWEFLLEGKPHKIELYDSKWSGKKKIVKDGICLLETEEEAAFSKSFDIGGHNCNIIQYGDKFELRIDNNSFSHLYDLERNKVYFAQDSGPTSTTYSSQPVVQTNKFGFGLSNLSGVKTDNSTKPAGLFNFSIKPATNPTTTSTTTQPKKVFGFNPGQDIKKDNEDEEEEEENVPTTQGQSGGALFNFTVNSSTTQNKVVKEKPSEKNPVIDPNDLFQTASNTNTNLNQGDLLDSLFSQGNTYTQKNVKSNDIIDLSGGQSQSNQIPSSNNNNFQNNNQVPQNNFNQFNNQFTMNFQGQDMFNQMNNNYLQMGSANPYLQFNQMGQNNFLQLGQQTLVPYANPTNPNTLQNTSTTMPQMDNTFPNIPLSLGQKPSITTTTSTNTNTNPAMNGINFNLTANVGTTNTAPNTNNSKNQDPLFDLFG